MAITLKDIKAAMAQPPETVEQREARYAAWRESERRKIAANKGKPPHFDGNSFVFSSGRSVHGSLFSVSEDAKELTYGYDGTVPWPPNRGWIAEPDDDPDGFDLTADDMRELADMMMAKWQQFKAGLK